MEKIYWNFITKDAHHLEEDIIEWTIDNNITKFSPEQLGILRTTIGNKKGIFAIVKVISFPKEKSGVTTVDIEIIKKFYKNPILYNELESYSNIKYVQNVALLKKEIFDKILQLRSDENIEIEMIEEVLNKEIIGKEKEYITKIRIGHSEFKKFLSKIYKKCALCEINKEEFLIASHIKPWSRSDEKEKVDINNGLLLCPHHDFLFDKGLIAFSEEGNIIISSSLSQNEQALFNINENLKLDLNNEQSFYIKWHRENLLRK